MLRTTCRICRPRCGLRIFIHWIATFIPIPQISQNKGLTAKKKKELRNPRVKHRKKFYKAKVKRKSQVCCGKFLDRLSLHLNCFLTVHVHSTTREQFSAVNNRGVHILRNLVTDRKVKKVIILRKKSNMISTAELRLS